MTAAFHRWLSIPAHDGVKQNPLACGRFILGEPNGRLYAAICDGTFTRQIVRDVPPSPKRAKRKSRREVVEQSCPTWPLNPSERDICIMWMAAVVWLQHGALRPLYKGE